MSMTKQEKIMKLWLIRKLKSQGYLTYAKLLREFDLRIDNRPDIVAYMSPETGEIAINPNIDDNQASVIIRHEILHGYLQHEKRLLDKLSKEHELDEVPLSELKNELYGNDLFNIAGDYEISNKGYTEKDKETVRNILLNGRILSGLVTEDQHPDWVDMSIEEMYDELRKEKKKAEQEAKDEEAILGALIDETTFLGADGVIYGV